MKELKKIKSQKESRDRAREKRLKVPLQTIAISKGEFEKLYPRKDHKVIF